MSFRTLLIETPSYQNENYIKNKRFLSRKYKRIT